MSIEHGDASIHPANLDPAALQFTEFLLAMNDEQLVAEGYQVRHLTEGSAIIPTAELAPLSETIENAPVAVLDLAGTPAQLMTVGNGGWMLTKPGYKPSNPDDEIPLHDVPVFLLPDNTQTLGREERGAGRLNLKTNVHISRSHASLTVRTQGGREVLDIIDHSTNGTRLITRPAESVSPEPQRESAVTSIGRLATRR